MTPLLLALFLGAAQAQEGPPPQPADSPNVLPPLNPKAAEILDLAVEKAGDPVGRRALLQARLNEAKSGDGRGVPNLEAAVAVSDSLAANNVTDPGAVRLLLQQALSDDEGTRERAKAMAARTTPDSPPPVPPPGGPPGTPSGAGGPQGAPSGGPQGAPPPQSGGALAIPGSARSGPSAAMSPDKLATLRRYRTERLVLRSEVEFQGGDTWVYGGGTVGWRRPGFGVTMGPTLVVQEPPTAIRTWGIYQGPQRLDTPDFLRVSGQADRASALQTDIDRATGASKVWFGAAGVGVASMLGGVLGMILVPGTDGDAVWNTMALGGMGVSAVGFIGGSFPASKARRLDHDVSATVAIDEAQRLVDGRNDALRADLGLTPDEVWQVEMAPDGHR